jgi:hypothetical protein
MVGELPHAIRPPDRRQPSGIPTGFSAAAALSRISPPRWISRHPPGAYALVGLVVLGTGTVYRIGVGLLTRRLHRETGAATPWKGSFAAAGVLALATVLAAFS